MPAEAAAAQRRARVGCELPSDVLAVGIAGLAGGRQRAACLKHEGLHLGRRDADDASYLDMPEIGYLGQEQRLTLLLGKRLQVADQVAQLLAPLELVRRWLRGSLPTVQRTKGRMSAAPAQERATAVAGDREQPRPQIERPSCLHDLAIRDVERVLDRVLGVLPLPRQMAAEGEQVRAVTRVQALECLLVVRACERDQALIAVSPIREHGVSHLYRRMPGGATAYATGGRYPALARLPGQRFGSLIARAGRVGEPEEHRVAHVLSNAHAFACRLAFELSPEFGRESDSCRSHVPVSTRRLRRGWTLGWPKIVELTASTPDPSGLHQI